MNRVAVVDQVDQVNQVGVDQGKQVVVDQENQMVVDQGKKRLRALTEDTGTVHKKGEGKV